MDRGIPPENIIEYEPSTDPDIMEQKDRDKLNPSKSRSAQGGRHENFTMGQKKNMEKKERLKQRARGNIG